MASWKAPGSILEAPGLDFGRLRDDFFEIFASRKMPEALCGWHILRHWFVLRHWVVRNREMAESLPSHTASASNACASVSWQRWARIHGHWKFFVFDAPKAGGSGNEAASEKNYSFLLDDALLIRCAFYRYACCADACRHWSLQEYLSVVRFQLHPCFKTDPKLRWFPTVSNTWNMD